ncbi:hypothetical protein DIPPA_00274 [Diplonema papillatum]|nr:hypothetical protein DIPPA_00274 [Diplonema papillatum]
MPNLKSRSTQGPPHLKRAWYGKFPYFADGLYTPEGWDSRVADDNLRSLIKDTVYPHTPFQRGQLPFIEHKLKYGKGMPDYVPHAGAPGGVIAPPI